MQRYQCGDSGRGLAMKEVKHLFKDIAWRELSKRGLEGRS